MNPKKALIDLKDGKSWPIYYLYGDETFKIDEFISKIRETVFSEGGDTDFSVDRVDGATSTGSDVLSCIQSMGLFGGGGAGRRLVIVRRAHQLKKIEELSKIIMNEKYPWGDSVLIFVAEGLDRRKKFNQFLKKKGYALEFKNPRDMELSQWVQYMAKKLKCTVEPQAAELLAVISDGSLQKLSQEIEKAWLYAGAKEDLKITAEHVTAVASQQISHEMIELVEAILKEKRTRALLLTEKLIHSSENALGLVGFLNWAIKNPNTNRRLQSRKKPRELISALVDLDLSLKSSGLEPRALVEQFVIEQTHAV